MIGRLRGEILEVEDGHTLIEVQGVGYVVQCGARTLARLQPGQETILHIESLTREDGTRLIGFLDRGERQTFTTLINVQGVGPKAALAILDVLSLQDLMKAIAFDDKAAIARANGVGPKLAARLITELKDKPLAGTAAGFAPTVVSATVSEAVAALVSLGLNDAMARRGVDQALKTHGDTAPVQDLIKTALKQVKA